MMRLTSRRSFLQASGLAAGAAAAAPLYVHAAEQNTIRIALIGAGGRGRGAAINALKTEGPTQLVALADAFPDRTANSANALVKQMASQPGKVDLPEERRFSGLNAYKQAIDCLKPGDVAICASCCGFRPLHVEYAVSKGVNVFMEKPFASDSPGTRRIQAAAKLADEKNIKIACGLMWRHSKAREQVIERIHNGEIGELIHLRGFRMHNPYGSMKTDKEPGTVEYQIKRFHAFDWAGGNLFIDYCIHNIDVACWAKGAWPVSCIGLG
ncbi:MAG: Gfo/Idh/MocA family oxidoreductase, partial [Planctomycetaceae bacterium]|nr:Gfo/Idh/MocA family oxidoreductase [Planctomycetaceae bacterium]